MRPAAPETIRKMFKCQNVCKELKFAAHKRAEQAGRTSKDQGNQLQTPAFGSWVRLQVRLHLQQSVQSGKLIRKYNGALLLDSLLLYSTGPWSPEGVLFHIL